MQSNNKGNLDSLKELFEELKDELENEQHAAIPQHEKVLADIARRMLRLERDMTMPGSQTQTSSRIERLAKFIEEENF